MRTTLHDIAQRANVSISTVSRVLNNYPHVDEATKEVVQQAALELNYPIDRLRGNAKQDMAVLLLRHDEAQVPGNVEPRGTELMLSSGIRQVLNLHDVKTYVHSLPLVNPPNGKLQLPNLEYRGIIVLGGRISLEFISTIRELNQPLVLAGAHALPEPVNFAMPDYMRGIEQAVNHLVERHRHKIGLVNGTSTTQSSFEKYRGLRLGLALNDLPFSPKHIIECDFTSEAGYQQTHLLLQQAPDLDAIIYASDTMAVGGMFALKELGKRIPEDVAVCGFHDEEHSRFSNPPLTTVQTNMEMVGYFAASRMLDLFDNPEDEANWMMLASTNLIVREST